MQQTNGALTLDSPLEVTAGNLEPDSQSSELLDHFLSLLGKFDTAILVTHQGDHGLHGRPMAIADTDADGTLWFLTSDDSPKVAEIAEDSRVLVTMQQDTRFIVASGRIRVVRDAKKIDELWKESDRVWFDGKDDPNLVLLSFFPEDAEFWDNSGSRGVRFVYRAAKAVLSGVPLKDLNDPTAHAKVSL
ncbi:MAG TPA: pyridoxamine 5'-phosphate oxidase family protein [Polyangiaceae bacterium]|nr:pyridoxamine 5'-phosphate oxidase family protein [Polyangiaceae bacterium]